MCVEGCTVFGNAIYSPIYTRDSRHVTVRNNNVYMTPKRYSRMKRSKNIQKDSNHIQPIEIVGVDIQNLSGNTIKN